MSFEYFEADSHVSTYNKFRPDPPEILIKRIAEYTSEKFSEPLELAVDVGCGSGQSTEVLAPYFKKILGLDSSSQIIQEAMIKSRNSNVFYSTSLGEKMNVENETANLVTACQALHWFDIPKFYSEAERILKPNGVLAVYGYKLPVLVYKDNKEIEKIVEKFSKPAVKLSSKYQAQAPAGDPHSKISWFRLLAYRILKLICRGINVLKLPQISKMNPLGTLTSLFPSLMASGLRPASSLQIPKHNTFGCSSDNDSSLKFLQYYRDFLGPYTLSQSRKAYLENYTSKEFNEVYFVEGGKMQREEDFLLESEGTIADIVGYITSWSAFQNYTKQRGEESGKKILNDFKQEFKDILELENDSDEKFKIKFNYFLLLGRKN